MWPNPQVPVDLFTFIEEFLNEKLYLCDQTLFGHLSFVDIISYTKSHLSNIIDDNCQ